MITLVGHLGANILQIELIEQVDYEEGEVREVEMHDGSQILLKKLNRDYDPMNKSEALRMLRETMDANEFLTGLIYVNPVAKNLFEMLNLTDQPLAHLQQEKLRPGPEALQEIMQELM